MMLQVCSARRPRKQETLLLLVLILGVERSSTTTTTANNCDERSTSILPESKLCSHRHIWCFAGFAQISLSSLG